MQQMQFVDRGLRCTGVERRLNQSMATAAVDANSAKSADKMPINAVIFGGVPIPQHKQSIYAVYRLKLKGLEALPI